MPPGIVVVGLGPGRAEQLTREAWDTLSGAEEVILRTREHPVVARLPDGLPLRSFDHLYEQSQDFPTLYETIVQELLHLGSRDEGVVYAVPGDPSIGEATVVGLRAAAAKDGLPLRLVPGLSFVEPVLAMLGVDALDGLSICDGLQLASSHHPPFPPDTPALIGQVYSQLVAAEIKLALMNQYPDDHPVMLIHSAGTDEATDEPLRLYEIDRSSSIGALSSLYVPALAEISAFESLQDTIARLRAPDGCPWDREQTHQSLRSHLLEEAYEALQAMDVQDMEALKEELGDLLIQVVLHAQIATEEGDFSMAEVIAATNEKIIARHPHVFGDMELEAVDEVLENWEWLKAQERGVKGKDRGVLNGVPNTLPALAQAAELQARAARVGFDWDDISGVLDKVREEIAEILEADSSEARFSELGDLLFACVNYARWLKVDPEAALREANRRFRFRFGRVEAVAEAEGRPLKEWSLEELERVWQSSKEED